jgi:hypothetical protein
MPELPFDLASVDWVTVAIYSGIAFLAAIVGNIIAMGNRFAGAVLTALFFAIFFVLWYYWVAAMVLPPAATTTPPI